MTKFVQVHSGTSLFVHPSFLCSVPLSCPQCGDPARSFPEIRRRLCHFLARYRFIPIDKRKISIFKKSIIMSVTYKKQFRKNPFLKDGSGKYYPQLLVWGKSATLNSIATQMKESSSLTLGDIQSVLTNFVKALRCELYNGRSVNVEGFGVFSLSASTTGSVLKKDCLPEKIKAVRINFRASSAIRPNLDPATTRAEDRIDFVDLETQLKRLNMPGADGEEGGGNQGGSGDGGIEDDPLG